MRQPIPVITRSKSIVFANTTFFSLDLFYDFVIPLLGREKSYAEAAGGRKAPVETGLENIVIVVNSHDFPALGTESTKSFSLVDDRSNSKKPKAQAEWPSTEEHRETQLLKFDPA